MNIITVDPDQNFGNQLNAADTVYVLSGTYNLGGVTVTVPTGCIFKFVEGTIITNGILFLNNTLFEGAKHCIRALVSGNQYELDTDDFDLTKSNKANIMQSILNTAKCVQLHGRLLNVFNDLVLPNREIWLIGNGATIENTSSITYAAIEISYDTFVRISDLNFKIAKGHAIIKNASRSDQTKLSFIIDNCRFYSSSTNVSSFIRLISSREGNITNCFFEFIESTSVRYGCIGIDRSNAVNTNVIGCMFSNLRYGIYAMGVHEQADDPEDPDAIPDMYTSYACGLNVQSAVMLGCEYGIYIEGNDSFFLNNSMIDFCVYPLVIVSQDGANITDNYFSATSYRLRKNETTPPPLEHTAVITVVDRTSEPKPELEPNPVPDPYTNETNRRIIIANNTIYGHRDANCNGLDIDVASMDCTIQGNTFDYFTTHGILLRQPHEVPPPTENKWVTEKLVIDNNRFHFGLFHVNGNNVNMHGICGDNYDGTNAIIITNNYAIEDKYNDGTLDIKTMLMAPETSYFGNYLSFGNHDYLLVNTVSNDIRQASLMNHSRMKLELTMQSTETQLVLDNPMPGEHNLVVYVANNPCPIGIDMSHVPDLQSRIIFTRANASSAITFTAIIERTYNL